jgi:DNA-binding transcriptional regulator PaaX
MDIPWLLLIYTVPAEPSRKRAFIWRELKKIGAPYLRDGVCILPERPETLELAGVIAAKVDEFGGEATLVRGARLTSGRSAALVEQLQDARAQEYQEIARDADQLLEHVAREMEHREFTYAELEELEADLGKLRRWADQVLARDYFGSGAPERLRDVLERCDRALGAFLERAAAEASAAP